eukprot:1466363-Rhodomonas_salina.3
MSHGKSELALAAIHLPSLLNGPKPQHKPGPRFLGDRLSTPDSDDGAAPADSYSKSTKNLLGITAQEALEEAEEQKRESILDRRFCSMLIMWTRRAELRLCRD